MRTIVHLSDLHFGRIDPPVLAALTAYLKTLPYDVLVVSGDFTQRSTAEQYREAMAWVNALPGTAKLYVPGNHDVPLYAVWERFLAPFRRYKKWVTQNLEPVWEDEELVVMGVATARAFVPIINGFWKDGSISAKTLRHVISRARKSEEHRKFSVVVTHHPFVPPPGHRPDGIVLGGKKVLPILADAGVDVVLAGHLHASYHEKMDVGGGRSIFSIQAATGTSTRRRHSPEGREYANGFNVLKCSANRLEIEVHAFTPIGSATGAWGLAQRNVYLKEGDNWSRETDSTGVS